MTINRIQSYLDGPKSDDPFQQVLSEYVLMRLEMFLIEIGDEVKSEARKADRPLKDFRVVIDGVSMAYIEAPNPLQKKRSDHG